jgi:hypothetical protein
VEKLLSDRAKAVSEGGDSPHDLRYVGVVHGDLDGRHILCDAEGVAHVLRMPVKLSPSGLPLRYIECCHGHVLTDLCKLMSCLLYDYTGASLKNDKELEVAVTMTAELASVHSLAAPISLKSAAQLGLSLYPRLKTCWKYIGILMTYVARYVKDDPDPLQLVVPMTRYAADALAFSQLDACDSANEASDIAAAAAQQVAHAAECVRARAEYDSQPLGIRPLVFTPPPKPPSDIPKRAWFQKRWALEAGLAFSTAVKQILTPPPKTDAAYGFLEGGPAGYKAPDAVEHRPPPAAVDAARAPPPLEPMAEDAYLRTLRRMHCCIPDPIAGAGAPLDIAQQVFNVRFDPSDADDRVFGGDSGDSYEVIQEGELGGGGGGGRHVKTPAQVRGTQNCTVITHRPTRAARGPTASGERHSNHAATRSPTRRRSVRPPTRPASCTCRPDSTRC